MNTGFCLRDNINDKNKRKNRRDTIIEINTNKENNNSKK